MIVSTVVKEFCDYNSEIWDYFFDYDSKGNQIIVIKSTVLKYGFKSIIIKKDDVTDIIIESNVLCICINNQIMVWLGGDTNTMQLDTTDFNNPLIKKE